MTGRSLALALAARYAGLLFVFGLAILPAVILDLAGLVTGRPRKKGRLPVVDEADASTASCNGERSGERQCDFCGDGVVVVSYPTSSFELRAGEKVVRVYTDEWMACSACKPLVQRKDIDGLVARATQSLSARPQGLPPGADRVIRAMHQGFLLACRWQELN
ncbi:MAG: hypothetical protein ACYDAG_04990 [Chloroflexota bacterium]